MLATSKERFSLTENEISFRILTVNNSTMPYEEKCSVKDLERELDVGNGRRATPRSNQCFRKQDFVQNTHSRKLDSAL